MTDAPGVSGWTAIVISAGAPGRARGGRARGEEIVARLLEWGRSL
ncbi:hypothetical protein AB0G73_34495 [Streptomyces sp. NPDC020719]